MFHKKYSIKLQLTHFLKIVCQFFFAIILDSQSKPSYKPSPLKAEVP